MSPNKISSSFWLFFLTLFILLSISLAVPQSVFDNLGLRKIDYLKPLLKVASKKITDTVFVVDTKGDTIKTVKITELTADTIPQHIKRPIVTIDDYSSDSSMLKNFIFSLKNCKDSGGTSRIAYYGDSFIEGDIMTGALRTSLQAEFGGKGLGFLPINNEGAYCRRLLPTDAQGWEEYSIAKQSKRGDMGIAGSSFVPKVVGSSFTIKPAHGVNGLYLYYKATKNTSIVHVFNRKNLRTDSLAASGHIIRKPICEGNKDTLRAYKLKLTDTNNIVMYGVSHENGKGVYIDNFSIRGNSGLGINQISSGAFLDFQRYMNYNLIVLQFGINVTTPECTDFSIYENNMVKLVNRLKRTFPKTAIMVVSVGDRSYKQEDQFVTMPSISILVESQRRVAQRTGVLFWNLWEAMGYEGGMLKLVDAGMANKDYTHISYGGGSLLAKELQKSIIQAYNSYVLK